MLVLNLQELFLVLAVRCLVLCVISGYGELCAASVGLRLAADLVAELRYVDAWTHHLLLECEVFAAFVLSPRRNYFCLRKACLVLLLLRIRLGMPVSLRPSAVVLASTAPLALIEIHDWRLVHRSDLPPLRDRRLILQAGARGQRLTVDVQCLVQVRLYIVPLATRELLLLVFEPLLRFEVDRLRQRQLLVTLVVDDHDAVVAAEGVGCAQRPLRIAANRFVRPATV